MSILSSMRYCLGPSDSYGPIWAALAFMPFGLFFDFMDGKVARWRGKSSLMGQELDSLADLVRGCDIDAPAHDYAFPILFLPKTILDSEHGKEQKMSIRSCLALGISSSASPPKNLAIRYARFQC